MEERNLDFEIPLNEEQWEQIGRRAKALRDSGFDWREDEPDRIHVYLRDEEARGLWSRLVSDDDKYGDSQVEIAQFVYNGGRPFAHLEAPPSVNEPSVASDEETAMELGQERWAREKWHYLLEESGLHFVRGHTSPGVERQK